MMAYLDSGDNAREWESENSSQWPAKKKTCLPDGQPFLDVLSSAVDIPSIHHALHSLLGDGSSQHSLQQALIARYTLINHSNLCIHVFG